MQRIALLIGAGIVTALVLACVPPPPGPAGGTPGALSCSASDFLSKITVVQSLPLIYPGSGTLAASGGAGSYTAPLTAVFNAAAGSNFQQVLCQPGAASGGSGVDVVYIVTAPCGGPQCLENSAGWWHDTSAGGRQRIVALSSSLLSGSYDGYENALTKALFPGSFVSYASPKCGGTPCSSNDSSALAALAALAHEIGHIRWFEWGINANPGGFCSGNFFVGWDPGTTTFQPPGGAHGGYWRDLLTFYARERVRSHPAYPYSGYFYTHSVSGGPQIDDIDIQPGGGPAQSFELYSLLSAQSSPWASLFAALSPDEDFVEAYKLKVLMNASPPLTSVSLTIGWNPALDIPQGVGSGARSVLNDKLATCIKAY
jgi:hypothetical protein